MFSHGTMFLDTHCVKAQYLTARLFCYDKLLFLFTDNLINSKLTMIRELSPLNRITKESYSSQNQYILLVLHLSHDRPD